MKKIIIAIILILSVGLLAYWGPTVFNKLGLIKTETTQHLSGQIQNGDIIFQTSKSRQSKAIQLATNSVYSHMGIVYIENGKSYVYEAVQPVKLTPLKAWIKRGKDAKFVIKRLKNADEILRPAIMKKIKAEGLKYKGKNYDKYFEWSDDKIYCSELVYKIYKSATGIEIGKIQKLSDFDLENGLVQKIMKERYGDSIPLNESVISPVAMFNSELLRTVNL